MDSKEYEEHYSVNVTPEEFLLYQQYVTEMLNSMYEWSGLENTPLVNINGSLYIKQGDDTNEKI